MIDEGRIVEEGAPEVLLADKKGRSDPIASFHISINFLHKFETVASLDYLFTEMQLKSFEEKSFLSEELLYICY